jgi:hypothetical protein
MHILSLSLALTFTTLAALHLYWAAGGRWGGTAALPKTEDGSPLFSPGPTACTVVALGLLGMAYLCLAQGGLVRWLGPAPALHWLVLGMGGVFALRALGDFKYVGVFKKIRTTDFGLMDTRYYTPLCCILALSLFALAFNSLSPVHAHEPPRKAQLR